MLQKEGGLLWRRMGVKIVKGRRSSINVKKKERTTTGLKENCISVALKERSNCDKKRTKVVFT